MSPVRARAARFGSRKPLVAAGPARFQVFVAVVTTATVACSVVSLLDLRVRDAHGWLLFVLLSALAVTFEEGSRRVSRMRIRLSKSLTRDMTSVWSIAAAVALSPALAVALQAVLFTFIWFRQERPAGESLYRRVGSRSTVVLGCLAAMQAKDLVTASAHLPAAATAAISVVVVIVVHTVVNRSLVTVALLLLGARGADLLSGQDENLLELATLCLGGLVALAAVYEPWLCLLVLPPMVSLQRGSLVRELETAATTDAKTGLLNAVALDHLGQSEVARAERESTSLAVLIVDIDRFKLVNDKHGHLVGDSVLRGVGRALTAGLREYDTVGRFGGEEFVALLPAADEAEALVVAERLRSHVEALRIASLDSRVDQGSDDLLSVSIGVSCYGVDGLSMPDLLFAADAALYKAKSAGRNRVVLAERGADGTPRETVSA